MSTTSRNGSADPYCNVAEAHFNAGENLVILHGRQRAMWKRGNEVLRKVSYTRACRMRDVFASTHSRQIKEMRPVRVESASEHEPMSAANEVRQVVLNMADYSCRELAALSGIGNFNFREAVKAGKLDGEKRPYGHTLRWRILANRQLIEYLEKRGISAELKLPVDEKRKPEPEQDNVEIEKLVEPQEQVREAPAFAFDPEPGIGEPFELRLEVDDVARLLDEFYAVRRDAVRSLQRLTNVRQRMISKAAQLHREAEQLLTLLNGEQMELPFGTPPRSMFNSLKALIGIGG